MVDAPMDRFRQLMAELPLSYKITPATEALTQQFQTDLSAAASRTDDNDVPALNGVEKNLTQQFRASLLDWASATEDNAAGVNGVEIGPVVRLEWDVMKIQMGLKVASKPILLSDLLYALEDAPMPIVIKTQFPELTEAEWQAASRVISLMLMSFNQQLLP